MSFAHQSITRSLLTVALCASIVFATTFPQKLHALLDNIGANAAQTISEAGDRAINTLNDLHQKFGVDVRRALEDVQKIIQGAFVQLDGTVNQTLEELQAIVSDVEKQLAALVAQFIDGIDKAIRCVGPSLADAIESLAANTKVFGINIDPKTLTDLDAYAKFTRLRDDTLKVLREKDATFNAEFVMSLNDGLANVADAAQCLYPKTSATFRRLGEQAVLFRETAWSWYYIIHYR